MSKSDEGSSAQPIPSYTCSRCGRTSYNPNDVRERYCGACHVQAAPMGQPPLQLDPNDPLWWVELGAEPFWMQDVRLAQKRIEAERARLRSQRAGGPPSDEGSGS